MILHDRLELVKPGGTDRYGNPMPPASMGMFPADVQPLSTEELAAYGTTETRVRVFMPALDVAIESTWTAKHDGKTYSFDGSPEVWKVRGRVHHIEAVMVRF